MPADPYTELNEHGFGRCSVPMWMMGSPAGRCDALAYGNRPRCAIYRNAYSGREFRADGRYDGYVPGLACPAHGGPDIRTFMDGNAWCAVLPTFVNIQESLAGFGDTPEQAIEALLKGVNDAR